MTPSDPVNGLVEELLQAPALTPSMQDLHWRCAAALSSLADELERVRGEPVSLDTLPFWPWLWADPTQDTEDPKVMAERRLRANYETARAPIPNQYALVHRWDLTTLFHELWHKRAKSGLADDYKSRALTAEAALAASERRVERLEAALRPFAEPHFMGDHYVKFAPRLIETARAVLNPTDPVSPP